VGSGQAAFGPLQRLADHHLSKKASQRRLQFPSFLLEKLMSEAPTRLGPMIETVAGLRDILKAQVKQLHLHAFNIKHLRTEQGDELQGEPEVYAVIGPMIHMAAVSGLSLLLLTENISLNVKDAFPIARSVVESIVNACYLMAEKKSEAVRAIRHAEFKSLRDLDREWHVGPISQTVKWEAELSAEAKARFTELSREFVTAKGRDRSWTDKSLRQRLEAAYLRFDHNSLRLLSASVLNIYNTASEVVHGSYFSALYFFGLTSPAGKVPQSTDEFSLTLVDHQVSVLFSVIFACASFVECFSSYSGQPHLLDDVNEALRQMRELPSIAETLV
jgi:hypothetical protein